MMDVAELETMARAIVDGNSYMTLGTADADGLPWASPVWCARTSYREFFWLSKPGARHSQNIAVRPEVRHRHLRLDGSDRHWQGRLHGRSRRRGHRRG